MPILLPLIFFGLLFLILRKNDPDAEWRPAFLAAAVGTGVLLTAITEGLSLFHKLNAAFVAGSWLLAAVLLVLLRRKDLRKRTAFPILAFPARAALAPVDWIWPAAAALIALALGAVAFAAPPNTWDSMTYHMPRVVHWIQNGGVDFYPTNILRQLHQNPWTEYAILHAQLLSGGDRFANGVQWLSMLGACVGVSLLAKYLGADARGQILAAFAAATLPMGLMQATSTQTDYAEAFWLAAAVYFLLRLKEEPRGGFALAAGSGLGLAILTKATAYLFALPFLVWTVLALIRPRSWRAIRLFALVAITAAALNFGFYYRNYTLYGNPLGPGTEGANSYTNGVFSAASLASNVVRNLALQIGTPFPEINLLMERGINFLHRLGGFSSSDPRTTWSPYSFHVPALSYFDDDAGNPLHLILFTLCAGILLINGRKNRKPLIFLLSLGAAFLLFCFVLKWQPWNSRLQLPLFVLAAALAGCALSRLRPERIWAARWAMLALLIGALPGMFNNPSRPLIGEKNVFAVARTDQYFTNMPSLAVPYEGAVQYTAGLSCQSIGLILGQDDWEYPFWVLLQNALHGRVRIEHVVVQNVSQRIASEEPLYADFHPCAVIAVNSELPAVILVSGAEYQADWHSEMVTVYRRVTDP